MKIFIAQTNYQRFLESFYKLHPPATLAFEDIRKLKARSLFGTADYYSYYLKRLGHKVFETVIDDHVEQTSWANENGFNAHPDWWSRRLRWLPVRARQMLGIERGAYTIFLAQLKQMKPDVLYIHDLSMFDRFQLGRLKKYCRLVVGQIACPLPPKEYYEGYDLIISSFPHYVENFRKMGIKSERLDWCFDPRVLKLITKGKEKYGTVFVGGYSLYHSEGNRLLERLAREVDVDFWGYGVNQLSPLSPIRENYHGEVWGKEMFEIFSSARLVVNRHINVAGDWANNMRMFEVTGVGSLLLTDLKKNLEEFFRIDQEIVTYGGGDELVEKAKFYLNHPLIARKIARAGQRRTLSDHGYDKRMKELSGILRKYL